MIERQIRDVATPRTPTISSETSVRKAAGYLRRPDVPAVIVLEDDAIAGILTRSDIVAMVAETNAPSEAGAIMSTPVTTVTPETTLVEAAKAMRENGIEHLPVVEGTDYEGLVSARTLAPYLSRHRLDIQPADGPPRIEATETAGMTTGD